MYKKYFIVLLCSLGFITQVVLAQTNLQAINNSGVTAHIRLKTSVHKDRVMLRWAVDNPSVWKETNKTGFILKRYTVARNGQSLSQAEVKVLGTFRPAPEADWQSIVETNDYAAIVAQALYGESFEVEMENSGNAIDAVVNKSEESAQRFAYALMAADLDFNVAVLAGWGYTDTSILPHERYLYVVDWNAEGGVETQPAIEKGSAVADVSMALDLPKPLDFIGIFQDKTVTLSWEYQQLQDYYTIYFLEKAEDGVSFQPLTDLPVMNMSDNGENIQGMVYIDSLKTNDNRYAYRLRGKTIFGEYGPYSDVVSGAGKKTLEFSPRILSYDILPNQDIQLHWEFPKEAEKDLSGFELLHSETDGDKSYKMIKSAIAPSERQVTTQNIASANYFKIKAISKSGESRESFAALVQLDDSIPPATPTELAGKIDSTGVVSLTWKPNTEMDLEGYHVFRATQQGEEPVRLTPRLITEAFFTDTISLKSLNSKVYYYVLSSDKRKNESELSEMLELEKPDIIPPQAPIFTDYKIENGSITLKWVKSYSDDVAAHQLWRQARDGNNKQWYKVYETTEIKPDYSFIDTDVKDDVHYAYFLIAIDKSELKSNASSKITLKNFNPKPREVIKNINGSANKSKNRIDVIWQVDNNEVVEILVYRNQEGQQPTLWGTLSGAQNFLEDQSVQPGNRYTYLLKAMLKSNQPTKTEKITVDY